MVARPLHSHAKTRERGLVTADVVGDTAPIPSAAHLYAPIAYDLRRQIKEDPSLNLPLAEVMVDRERGDYRTSRWRVVLLGIFTLLGGLALRPRQPEPVPVRRPFEGW